MTACLFDIFEKILPPTEATDKLLYSVIPVPGHTSYFIGKDRESLACFLISTLDQTRRSHPPIRLESLDAQFDLHCRLKKANEPECEGTFTVIRCRDNDSETTRYFLSVCETILRMIGDKPTRNQISRVVNRLAAIFQKARQSPTRPISGLFGELYLVLHSGNAERALRAWRIDENARFDFSDGDARLDVKTTVTRNRIHTFSYEQCNPPSNTIAVVASLNVEQIAGGVSLRTLIEQIESRISTNVDLIFKLHESVAATLGAGLNDALSRRFDMRLAEASLRFYYLNDVPAIRGPLPAGVSDVHFRSDLSTLAPLSIEALIDRDPVFWDILPRMNSDI